MVDNECIYSGNVLLQPVNPMPTTPTAGDAFANIRQLQAAEMTEASNLAVTGS